MRALTPRRRARLYAYAAVTSALVLMFALAEWGAAKYVFDRSRAASTMLEIGLVLLAALVFQPFHKRAEAAVESAFTRHRRQAIEALTRFRSELTSFNDLSQLLRRVVDAVERHTESSGIAVYLRRDRYRAEASSFETPATDVEIDDPLIVRLRSTGTPAAPQSLKSAAAGTSAFPMTVAGDVIGFVCVEAKFGELEPEELQALATLSESLGLALVELDPQLRAPTIETPNNLPADLSPLIGRGDEIAELKALLTQSRLVTLTGAGGVGKTRLALHLASELRAYRDGCWLVDLAPLADAALIPSAIARVFEIADEGGDASLLERVGSYVKQRQLLLVLDNCEHLIRAAAEVVEYLLQRCSRIEIIATSREPLSLPAEEVYRVPSLSGTDSVLLFVARARSADRDFALTDENAATVAEIVRRLDGIPMAIELAAPRLKVLSVEQLRARLDERFELLTGASRTALPRHQTLRALIAWSYDLLSEREQHVLRCCSLLRADWSLEAAEAIAGEAVENEWQTLDLLEALVDKSLVTVQREGAVRRYRLLESTREFALERLNERGERATVGRRYIAYYAKLAEEAASAYWSADSDAWNASVRAELENYRGAIAAGIGDDGDADAAAAIVGNLRWFWYTVARREGAQHLDRLRTSAGSRVERTRGLIALCAALLDTSASALISAEQAAATLQDEGDSVASVEARVLEATALGRAGRVAASCASFDGALASARALRLPRLLGWALGLAAYWHGAYGESAEARAYFDEAAIVLRGCGDAWQVARLHVHRAEFLFAQSEIDAALQSVREAEAVFRERESASGLCVALLNATAYLLALGRFDQAWECAREGLQIAIELEHPMGRAWAIGHFAELAAHGGDFTRCAMLLGHADAIYAQTGGTREPTERRGYEYALQLVRAHLEEKEMFAHMSAGATAEVEVIAREATSIPRPKMHAGVLH